MPYIVLPYLISYYLILSHFIITYLILSELISYYRLSCSLMLSHAHILLSFLLPLTIDEFESISHAHILLSFLLPLIIDEFESRCSALIARLQVCVLQCLEESGLDKSQLSEVEIVGQSHHILRSSSFTDCHATQINRIALIGFDLRIKQIRLTILIYSTTSPLVWFSFKRYHMNPQFSSACAFLSFPLSLLSSPRPLPNPSNRSNRTYC